MSDWLSGDGEHITQFPQFLTWFHATLEKNEC
jgi:hypothetical protein